MLSMLSPIEQFLKNVVTYFGLIFIISNSFDIGSNMWKALPRMPHPLRKIVGIEMNGKIFVSGFVNETAAKYWCIYNTKSKKWMRTRSLGDHDHPTGMKTIVAKRDNHALNITLDSNDILCYEYDTKKHRFESSR